MSEPPLRIVILGGGTAGWMTACLFAERWLKPGARPITITLVESPQVGIIGVGEGSTPQLKALFDRLGLAERDWMPRANATYKVGIRFTGWSERPAFDSYFHPFPSAIDVHTQPAFFANCTARRRGGDVPAHPDRFYLPTRLADRRLGPQPAENFPFEPSYGYHFDAHEVGRVLRDEAVRRGVTHLERHVTRVAVDASGAVTHLDCQEGEPIAGDFFVDSSGFRAVIAEGAIGGKFLPFESNLFNDSAVVMPTPLPDGGTPAATSATALSAGWAWAIPLTSRVGNGYVYSSRYVDPQAAEAELRRHLGLPEDGPPARHLKMKVGRLESSWASNCLAVGLAQGFIEPLEATALHIVQATAEEFMAAFEAGGFTPQHRDTFNARIARRYDGIRDYIVAHYRMSQRSDSDYWRDARSHDRLSDSLKAMMTAWFTGADIDAEIERQQIANYYASISWHCLFAGYGTFPEDARLKPATGADLDAITRFLDRAQMNFTSHDAALAALRP